MRKTLVARQGYILTDGENFAKIVDLAKGTSDGVWHEITEAEYEKIKKEKCL